MNSFLRYFVLSTKALKFLKILKSAKAFKLMASSVSLFISVVAYGLAYNSWVFGIGLVGLLTIHEAGHIWAARRVGVPASLPAFIPFLGAVIFTPKFTSVRKEAFVAVGGPVIGSAAALLLAIPYLLGGDKIWLVFSYLGLILNVFNLIPLKPLDGGRITIILGRGIRGVGFALLGVASLYVHQPVMLLIWVLVLQDMALPLWYRPVAGTLAGGTMVGLMLLGYSDQPFWADIIDCTLVVFILSGYWWADQTIARGGADPFVETYDDTTTISSGERSTWLVIWLGLIVVLGGIAFWEHSVLGNLITH